MANKEHVYLFFHLKKWVDWRRSHPDVVPDLSAMEFDDDFIPHVIEYISALGTLSNGGRIEAVKSKWVGSISLDKGGQKVFYGKTKKEVTEKLVQFRHEQQQGVLIPTSQQALAEFLQLQAFYELKLNSGLSPTTVTTIHNVLHKALQSAVKWNLVARNVCKLVSPPRRERFEVKVLSLEEIQKLLSVARGRDIEGLLCLAVATGLRRGELMGLKWQDIDLVAGTLQVKRTLSRVPSKMEGQGYVEADTKTKKSRRSIVIAPFAIEALKQHRIRQLEAKLKVGSAWQENGYVFCTSIGTHVNPTRDILDPFKALLKEAGLPDVRFHDLRHSSATLLLSAGIHPKVVQEVLGHSNISITMDIYSHVLPNMQKDAMSRLDALIDEKKGEDEASSGK
ncbi:tyrosine-type recombinase/integrase [Dictyobacter formicarum]|uniref:Site-specific integrase n=1 Tax=Dictyobacter formicarum TaxID=2778368 RepID=A0ABQ3VE06_9CHLR|nr:site-specific integrase [Dictyobacter formicarum]GHO84395.1 site-specific integrase [Dictyobacter formicarum]